MRNRLVGLFGAISMIATSACAPMGYLRLKGYDYYFDAAAFAVIRDRTVLSLSSEVKPSWQLLSTTRHVWIVFPGAPVEGRCEIADSECSLRYVENLGLELGLICAANGETPRGACEIPESFGEWAESGSVEVWQFVEGDRLEGRFEVTTPKGELSGKFKARFDPVAAAELIRLWKEPARR